jgi:hypothetical protein
MVYLLSEFTKFANELRDAVRSGIEREICPGREVDFISGDLRNG